MDYAFEASSGNVRWRYDVKGPIPGTPTVIGTTVYTSSFKTQEMVGVDAKSGKACTGSRLPDTPR